jgi:NitT/TauT family transport system substrate-binding protein
MSRRASPTLIASALIIASGLALAGCAADTPEPAATSEAGLTTLRVSTLGLCDESISWGISEGIFADHGIEVELTTVQSGAAGIAAIQAGEVDVAYANPLTSLQAIAEGVALKIVSGTGLSTEDSNEVVVATDSEFEQATDLQGQTIALNALGGLAQIVTDAWIADAVGGDSTAQYVAIPFADQVSSVVGGSVPAAEVAASQSVSAQAEGTVRSLGNPFFDGIGEIPTAFYVADGAFEEANADTLASFAEAMTDTAESANDTANDEARDAVRAESCMSTVEALEGSAEPKYEGQLDMDNFDTLVTLLTDSEAIAEIDVDSIVPSYAQAG